MKRRLESILILLLMASGIAMLLYPTATQWWNARHQSQVIVSYRDTVSALEQERLDELWTAAETYNETHPRQGLMLQEGEDQAYRETLDVTGTGVMGYLVIPTIGVNLPIYHGSEEAVLQVGVGHLSGTSLPVGGKGTHCVLSGHRGLPTAKLLTDLNKLELGDQFYLQVLGKTLTYQVDQILEVDPSETEALAVDPEEDYCTLVTCTPYGINSQRLLVRGTRVETEEAPQEETVSVQVTHLDWPVIPACIILALTLLILFLRRRRHHET
jgi:sortase A